MQFFLRKDPSSGLHRLQDIIRSPELPVLDENQRSKQHQTPVTHSRFHLGSEEHKAVGVDLLPFANIVYSNLEVTDDSAIAQGNNHCYEHEHESTGRNPTDSHMGYEQEERYEDLRERNQAPDMYGSRRNYATTHNPRRNESEFMHRERTTEPRCRQEQRTAGSLDPLIVLVQGLLDRLDHRTGESSEQRPSSSPNYLKMDNLIEGQAEEEGMTDGLGVAQICVTLVVKGHYANSFPHKRQVTLPAPPTRLAIELTPKRQAVGKQVKALELGKPEPQQPHQGSIRAIVKVRVSIRTPRNHNLHAVSCVLGIPIHVGSMVYPADLLVVPLGQHEVILGMDCLSRYYTQLNCGRGRITLEEKGQPSTKYYGICPSSGVSLVSALRVKKDLIKGEVYLVTLTTLGGDLKEGTQLEEIPVGEKYSGIISSSLQAGPRPSGPR
ncbi:hypothetical protein F2Q68_00040188 [Brassica cretica]|uniref:Uncharacterized protein n=1 Tax=Brassica cretica TaxID=69181 RepID=A0A8S9MJP5_BRACR|nr:hypothetical protein F2Q68_00040188 [Brassica cretica]